jgi:hypothetical protein
MKTIFDVCVWLGIGIAKIAGVLLALLILVAILGAHHRGKNIWLALFSRGGFKNWL